MKLSLLMIMWAFTFTANNSTYPKQYSSNLNILIGEWKLDMSPYDKTDDNFAMMKITRINESSFEGEFYREGVNIRHAQTNTQLGKIYGSLVSGDNSGTYNSTFYLEDGILHGTTHAIEREFLAVWTAEKVK